MKRLTDFVNKFEDFMKKLNREPRSSTASIKDFENLFSVTYEASLLREIQDIKDELKMLSEVFLDQQCVLQAAGKKFSEDRDKKNLYPSSTFKYDQQSLKHGNHVERMLIQANQAYDTVSDNNITANNLAWQLICHYLVEGSFESQTAASQCTRSTCQPKSANRIGRAGANNIGIYYRHHHFRKHYIYPLDALLCT
jgi:hypothetical protein